MQETAQSTAKNQLLFSWFN